MTPTTKPPPAADVCITLATEDAEALSRAAKWHERGSPCIGAAYRAAARLLENAVEVQKKALDAAAIDPEDKP